MSFRRLRFRALWLLALSLCLPALAVQLRAQSKNVLLNPGFEEPLAGHPWMPAGWDTSRAGLLSVFFGRDTFSVRSGTYGVSVANVSMLYTMAHNWGQGLLVGPDVWDKDAVFSIWTRNNGVEGRAFVKVDAYRDTITKMAKIWSMERDQAAKRLNISLIDDPVLSLGWKRLFFSENETDWVRREVRVYTPPGVNVVFARAGLLGTGQLVIDDASLTFEPALPAPDLPLGTNLLADPGFEGDGNDWEHSIPPYPEMQVVRDTTVKHSGRASVGFRSPPAAMVPGPAGVCQVLCNRNFSGKRVRFSGWIKTDSLTGSSAFLKIYSHSSQGVQQRVSTDIIDGTMDWRQTAVEMDMPEQTYEVWAWFTYTAPAPGRVYFDDASLVVLGPAQTKP